MRLPHYLTAGFLFLTTFTSAGLVRRAESLSEISTSALSDVVSTTSVEDISVTASDTASTSPITSDFGGNLNSSIPTGSFVNATAILDSSALISETPSTIVEAPTSTDTISSTLSDIVSSTEAAPGQSDTPPSVTISSTLSDTTLSASDSAIPLNTSSINLSETSFISNSEVPPAQSQPLPSVTLPGPLPTAPETLGTFPTQATLPATTSSTEVTLPTGSMPRLPLASVIIDGETYTLPREGSFRLLLEDDSEIILFPTFIQKGEEKLPIPAVIGQPSTLSLQGREIRLQPGKPPRQGQPRSRDDLFSIFRGLSGAINSAVSSVNDAVKQAENLAKAPADGFMSGLSVFESFMSGIGSSLNTVTDTLEAIESIELDDLSQADRALVTQTEAAAVELKNWKVVVTKLINQLKGIQANLPPIPDPVFDHLRKNFFTYVTSAGVINLGVLIQRLQDFDNKNAGVIVTTSSVALVTPTNIEEITRTTETTTKTSSATSSSSSAPPEPTFLYTICTKEGTSLETFDKFTKGLDNNAGARSVHELVPTQTYMTHLTLVERKALDLLSFVDYVIQEAPSEEADAFWGFEFYKSPYKAYKNRTAAPIWTNSSQHTHFKHQHNKRALTTRPNSDSHLKILSQIRAVRDADYIADDSLGRGTTIYILDSGFAAIPEINTPNRQVTTYVVPNVFTLAGIPPIHQLPEDIHPRISPHGTCIASVAGGAVHGVASNADLHLIKIKGEQTNPQKPGPPDPSNPLLSGLRWAAVRDAFSRVRSDVAVKKLQGKAVVNLSWGVSATHPDNELFKRVLGDFIDWCGANGVVVVTAAGNDGDQSHFLHEFLPQKLGSQDNVLITVGGTHPDGSLWIGSRPQAAGREGSISIYAQGTDIRCSDRDGALRNEAGTSFSAAAISGLAAYLISLRSVNTGAPTVDVPELRAREIKNKLSSLAWVRFDGVINPAIYPDQPNGFSLPIPAQIPVAYNGALGLPDDPPPQLPRPPPEDKGCRPQKRDGPQESACSVAVGVPTTSTEIISTSPTPTESLTTTQPTEQAPPPEQTPPPPEQAPSPPPPIEKEPPPAPPTSGEKEPPPPPPPGDKEPPPPPPPSGEKEPPPPPPDQKEPPPPTDDKMQLSPSDGDKMQLSPSNGK